MLKYKQIMDYKGSLIMTEKVIGYQKSDVKENLLKNWSDLEGTELIELLTLSSELDSELYELALKKAPQLVKQNNKVVKTSKQTVKYASKMSKQTKKYYYKVSKAIMKLLKNDELAHELKLELIELLKEITIKIEKCDERDKHFWGEQHKKTVSYGTMALLTVAAIYGVVANKKS